MRSHNYDPEAFLADTSGNNIVGTLFEECFHNVDLGVAETNPLAMTLGEVRSVQKISDKYKGSATELCRGMNAHADLSAGAEAIEPILAEMSKYPVMRGIRESLAATENPTYPELFNASAGKPGGAMGICDSPEFRSGYALLKKFGFSFDAWCCECRPACTHVPRTSGLMRGNAVNCISAVIHFPCSHHVHLALLMCVAMLQIISRSRWLRASPRTFQIFPSASAIWARRCS